MCQQQNPQDFHIVDGVLLKYSGHASCVRVPDGVIRIGPGAFTELVTVLSGPPSMASWDGIENPHPDVLSKKEIRGFRFIQSVYLPDGLEEIGENAFTWSASLESVRFPQSLRRICKGAFTDCFRLKHIEVPRDVVIEEKAFNSLKLQITYT